MAGPALTWRTGGIFSGYSGTVAPGWSVGLGATLKTGGLQFPADIEDVIYTLALDDTLVQTERSARHELLVTVGLTLIQPKRLPGDRALR
jgi:hypothetical protein